MKRKVILVQAAMMEGEKVKRVEKSYIASRTMPYLAALFPEYSNGEWETILIDDYLKGERIFDGTADLYAITAMGATLDRAVQIAQVLKSKNPNVPIIIGGSGPAAFFYENTDKIRDAIYFDSIFVGEAEVTLREFIKDFERGNVKKVYCSDKQILQELDVKIPEDSVYCAEEKSDLKGLPFPRYDLLKPHRYMKYPTGLRGLLQPKYRVPQIHLEFGRGCPHHCEFCVAHKFWGPGMRSRPVAEVIDELRLYPSETPVIFTDDNLGAIEKETIELLKEIIRVKEVEGYEWTFYGQFSTLATRNDELIELAGRAGFVTAFIGIESIEPESLCLAGKKFNLGTVDYDFLETLINLGLTKNQTKEASQRGIQVMALRRQGLDDEIIKDCVKENYLRIFRRLTAAGIYPLTSVIYGFDGDTVRTIRETTDFLIDAKIPLSFQWILVPATGTPLAKRLEKEKRLDSPIDLKKCDGRHVLFEPKKMSREELEHEFWASYCRFYSIPSILKRVLTSSLFSKRAYSSGILYTNLLYRSAVGNNIQPLSTGYRWFLESPAETI